MVRLPRKPAFWLGAFILWFVLLWLLSSLTGGGDFSPPIYHFDKVEHFGYFLVGSGLLCAWLYLRNPGNPNWKLIVCTAVFVLSLTGLLDEWHQSFTPGRSGNDPLDWLADFFGAIAGAFIFKRFHHQLM